MTTRMCISCFLIYVAGILVGKYPTLLFSFVSVILVSVGGLMAGRIAQRASYE